MDTLGIPFRQFVAAVSEFLSQGKWNDAFLMFHMPLFFSQPTRLAKDFLAL